MKGLFFLMAVFGGIRVSQTQLIFPPVVLVFNPNNRFLIEFNHQ